MKPIHLNMRSTGDTTAQQTIVNAIGEKVKVNWKRYGGGSVKQEPIRQGDLWQGRLSGDEGGHTVDVHADKNGRLHVYDALGPISDKQEPHEELELALLHAALILDHKAAGGK